MVMTPPTAEMNEYQTDAPPGAPACIGSPDSRVALTFEARTVPLEAGSGTRLARLSPGARTGTVTTTDAAPLTMAPEGLEITTSKVPPSWACTAVSVRQELVAPGMFTPLRRHW